MTTTDSSNEASVFSGTAIDHKWQARWEADRLSNTADSSDKPNWYSLTMYPYPSGILHVGHWYATVVPDAFARFKRRHGYNVLFPMGFDAFGLPAENAAIRNNIHPANWTYENIDHMRQQFRQMGAMIDWDREIITSDPSYYHWNQWIFLQDAGERPRLPQGRRSLVVPERPDGARQRAGAWTAISANAAVPKSTSAIWSSGISGSPNMPTNCWTGSTRSIGQIASRRCSATGSVAPRARAWSSARGRSRARGLHDAPRHGLGRDLHGAGARASAGRRIDDPGQCRGGRRISGFGPARDRDRAHVDRCREAQDRCLHWLRMRSIRSTTSGSRSGSPTTC